MVGGGRGWEEVWGGQQHSHQGTPLLPWWRLWNNVGRSGAGYVLWKLVAGSLRADTQRFPTDAAVVLLGFGRCGFIFFFAVLFLWVKFI